MIKNICTAAVAILLISACSSPPVIIDVPTVPGVAYVPASKTANIKPGEKIQDLFKINTEKEYALQKVDGGLYVMFSQFYNVPFYVGTTGVLVFDPAIGSDEALLKAIKEVTDLPITRIVYSHHHFDHIGGSAPLVEAMRARGVRVEVVATRKTAEILSDTGSTRQAPVTRTLDVAAGQTTLDFEGVKLKVVEFKYPTHSLDQAVFLVEPYNVVITPDFVSPDQLPFFRFSYAAANVGSYRENLEALNTLPWSRLIGGHGNFGSKADVNFLIEFIADLDREVAAARASAPEVDPVKYGSDTAIPYIQEPYIIKQVRAQLDSKYGRYYGYTYGIDSFIQEAIVYATTGIRAPRN